MPVLRSDKVEKQDMFYIRNLLRKRREVYPQAVRGEVERLAATAPALGVQRVILFGAVAKHEAGLTSDVDLLVVWDTPLGFLERTVELYRRLEPRVPLDLLVYTPEEMKRMTHNPLIRRACEEGRILYEA